MIPAHKSQQRDLWAGNLAKGLHECFFSVVVHYFAAI